MSLPQLRKALLSLFFPASTMAAQSAPTFNVITRMTVVESQYGFGTAGCPAPCVCCKGRVHGSIPQSAPAVFLSLRN